MNLEEPLLEDTSGVDREGHHNGNDQSGLPSWLDPVNDEDHRSLMSGISGSGDGGSNQNLTWADEPLTSSSRRDGNQYTPRLILGVRIINIATAIALITCSVSFCFESG